MNDRLLNWIKPQVDFDWTEYWSEQDRSSSFDQGPLAISYYQTDERRLLTGLFDELIAEIPESGRVLDVGCGNGAGSAALFSAADQQQKVINVDMLDLAHVRPPQSLAERVRITTGDAEQLPFPEQMFDLVLCCFSAEFCNILQVIRESHRVLKRRGRLGMFVYTRESPMVSIQSDYVNIYRNGLKQLLENMLAGLPVDRELILEIRSRIEQDDPRPNTRTHLEAIVDHLERLSTCSEAALVDVDALLLPSPTGQPNVFSVQTLQRRMALWDAIDHVALDLHDGFELRRRVSSSGFTDSYIIPAEFQCVRIGCFLAGERL
ncbi:MAG: methyltransferase domain-containing protein [Planctomycetaceae bacterium]|nr:methyltransferase domain-containing protein [Planctomycetaceae bacterium]